jgi:hypothetical protein
MANRESSTSWKDFLLVLKGRGLGGVILAVSDDHPGLKRAIMEAYQRYAKGLQEGNRRNSGSILTQVASIRLPSGFLNFIWSWSIEDATRKRLGAGRKAGLSTAAHPLRSGSWKRLQSDPPHRCRLSRKLSFNPSPEFKRLINCQRLPNGKGKRCGVKPRKHD